MNSLLANDILLVNDCLAARENGALYIATSKERRYVFPDEHSGCTLMTLMDIADKNMYENKAKIINMKRRAKDV